MKQKIVVALGGNAIQKRGERGTCEEQKANIEKTMQCIVDLAANNNCELVITHGNGPQVGNILIQNAAASGIVPSLPIDVCDAMSQGEVGYLIQQSLQNLLLQEKINRGVVTIVMQTLVAKEDPAFSNPSKPIGPFCSEAEARLAMRDGYIFKEDAGRGFRRVVPSPEPVKIVEINAIKELAKRGVIVIAAGGGGIPVIEEEGVLRGIAAVIDKDKTSALIADQIEANMLIVLTSVEKISLNYNTPQEVRLSRLTPPEAQQYLDEGHFAAGSMKPKVEAAIKFLEGGKKKRVLITDPNVFQEAYRGENGTWITRE